MIRTVSDWWSKSGAKVLAVLFILLCGWVAWLQATEVQNTKERVIQQERNDPCAQVPLPIKRCSLFLAGLANCEIMPVRLILFLNPDSHRCQAQRRDARNKARASDNQGVVGNGGSNPPNQPGGGDAPSAKQSPPITNPGNNKVSPGKGRGGQGPPGLAKK